MLLRKRDSRRDDFKMKNLTGWKADGETSSIGDCLMRHLDDFRF
jgi:hypothetical protein